MKKTLINGLLFIIAGFIIGNFIFGNSKEIIKNIQKKDIYYFLQEGVYKDKESLKKNLNILPNKTYDITNNEYHVYLGITKDYEVAEKLMSIYDKKGYKTYLKKKRIQSPKFSKNINQFDSLIKVTNEEDKILTIEEIVLANYMEIINK